MFLCDDMSTQDALFLIIIALVMIWYFSEYRENSCRSASSCESPTQADLLI